MVGVRSRAGLVISVIHIPSSVGNGPDSTDDGLSITSAGGSSFRSRRRPCP